VSKGVIPVGAALCAVVIAGCGSSSSSSGPSLSQFKSSFATEKSQLKSLGRDVAAGIQTASTKTNPQIATEFGSLASRATKLAAAIAKLKAPATYSSEVSRLSSNLANAGADLKTIAAAANAGDAAKAKSTASKLVQAAATVKSVDDSLSKALGLPVQ
jgi:hypothetical protein